MPDIAVGDKPKRIIRLAMWWLRKQLANGEDKASIHDDIMSCGNPALRKLLAIIVNDGANNINEVYQKALIRDGMELIFWTIYKDTAYRDPFFHVLKKILDKKEELYPLVENYYKDPDDWYINTWTKTKENTARLREEGKLTPDAMSPDEEIFVPQYQYKKVYDIIDKDTKHEKRRRGW